jgi:hypothetical protein
LAVSLLANHAAVLALDPYRVLALLGQRRSVYDQHGVFAPTNASPAWRSTCSYVAVDQGDVDTKWWSCCVCPGHTRSAIGSALLRAPDPKSPYKYSGAQQRCSERLKTAKKGFCRS